MKKYIFIVNLLTVILLAGHALAQSANDSKEDHEKMITIISKDFNVDRKQGTIIVDAIQYNRLKLLAVLQDKSLSPFIRNFRLKALNDEREAKIKSILTPQQLQRLRYLEQQHNVSAPNRGMPVNPSR